MRLFFATPCYRSDPRKAIDWAANCCKAIGIDGIVSVETMNPRLEAAREILETNFVKSTCDAILWRDDDINCEYNVVKRMLDVSSQIVICPYRKRIASELAWVTQGFGLTLLRRACVERMRFVYRELCSNDPHTVEGEELIGTFDPIYQRRGNRIHKLREDEAYFYRAKECGFEPHILDDTIIDHAGLQTHWKSKVTTG